MTQPPPPPGWYPDPAGGGGRRWWNGGGWTEHLRQPVQPPQPVAPRRSVLHDQPVLLVNQETELLELADEYAVLDGNGVQLGAVVEVGRSAAEKVVRFVSSLDQYLTHRLEVRDAYGPVLVLTRPAKLVRSRVVVETPEGAPVGEIVPASVLGRIRFDLVAGGHLAGAVHAENWRAWDVAVTDSAGVEVARITKTWGGLARTLSTTADRYVVRVHARLPEPLASLVLGSALTVDTALEQDARGFG